jgi:hypothetical protein
MFWSPEAYLPLQNLTAAPSHDEVILIATSFAVVFLSSFATVLPFPFATVLPSLLVIECSNHFEQALTTSAVASSVSCIIVPQCKQEHVPQPHTLVPPGVARCPPRCFPGAVPDRRKSPGAADRMLHRICGDQHGWCNRSAWLRVATTLLFRFFFGDSSYSYCPLVCIATPTYLLPGTTSFSSFLLTTNAPLSLRIGSATAALLPVFVCGVFIFPVVRVIVSH